MRKDVYAFWQWVEEKMASHGISSIAELERLAGVSSGTINKRKNALKFPTVEMAEGLCRALRVSWCELWEKAGFVERIDPRYLSGLDMEINNILSGVGEDFKRAVLKTIRTWLVLYEELQDQHHH